MKKISLYISVALVAFVGLISCQGRVFDPEEDLQDLSSEWAHEYVDLVLDQKILPEDSAYYKKWSVTTAYISDTLYKEIRNKYRSNPYRLDSVDVTSTFIQIHDSLIVKVDGYRFSEKYWAHLFTVGDGILEYEGKFHVDFYEIGKNTPWGWSETTYQKSPYEDARYPYEKKNVVGWY